MACDVAWLLFEYQMIDDDKRWKLNSTTVLPHRTEKYQPSINLIK